MSIQILLSHYLAGLRERDELDALLPEVLREMGHSVLSRPQVGVAQAGVDVVSTFENERGEKEVFLFIIKFGDLGRQDFYGGQQSIDPSVREAANDFTRNRLPADCAELVKRIVLVSNGTLKQEAQAGFSALTKDIADRPGCSLEFWGIDQLTPLIEAHIFNEGLLLDKGASNLRAALASLERTEISVERFIRFVDSVLKQPPEASEASAVTRRRRFLKRCTTASMGWAVLLGWGRTEGNLKPGVLAGEYLALRTWAEAVSLDLQDDAEFRSRMEVVLITQCQSLLDYYVKTGPALQLARAVAGYRPNDVLYNSFILEELGRLSVLMLMLCHVTEMEHQIAYCRDLLVAVVNAHPGSRLPVLDGQSIDLSLAALALVSCGDIAAAKSLVQGSIQRLGVAAKMDRYLPVDTDDIEDAMSLETADVSARREFFQVSSLAPALATMAAVLGLEDELAHLRVDVLPLMKGVTLERWFPTAELETLTSTGRSLGDVGVSRGLAKFSPSAAEESAASVRHFSSFAAPSDFKWHGTPFEVLVALSARWHRHPVPTWYTKQLVDAAFQAPLAMPAAAQSAAPA